MRKYLFFILLLVFSCASMITTLNEEAVETVKKRAVFEMNCSAEKLKITPLDTYQNGAYKQIGVQGCGKRGVYVQIAPNEWVLNSSLK